MPVGSVEGCEGPAHTGSAETAMNQNIFGHIMRVIKVDKITVRQIPVNPDRAHQKNQPGNTLNIFTAQVKPPSPGPSP